LFIIVFYKSISDCICGFINLFSFIYKSMIILGVSYVKEDKNPVLRSSGKERGLKSLKKVIIKNNLLKEKQSGREPKKKRSEELFSKECK
jgi:hypothetical protein